jgi:tRNA dimethylallyltransferase
MYPAIAIAGPTASGKSDLALYLAERFDGEIVNYDSLQLFRHLDIGTAKPSEDEQCRVPHHLIDILEPDEAFSAGQYQLRAREVLDDIRKRNKLPILVGGTGLYLRAVIEGIFDGPQRSTYWRARMEVIARVKGREYLHSLLERLDPPSALRIARRDLPKVIRALEVRFTTGRNLSSHLDEEPRRPIQGFAFDIVGLDPPRDALYERIEERVRRMWEVGLVEEVKRILESGVVPGANAFRAIGYRQVLEYIDGAITLNEAIMLTGRETRRYAKRQLTWFKKQHSLTWFDGFGSEDNMKKRIHRYIDHTFGISGQNPGFRTAGHSNKPSLGN